MASPHLLVEDVEDLRGIGYTLEEFNTTFNVQKQPKASCKGYVIACSCYDGDGYEHESVLPRVYLSKVACQQALLALVKTWLEYKPNPDDYFARMYSHTGRYPNSARRFVEYHDSWFLNGSGITLADGTWVHNGLYYVKEVDM